MYKTLILTLAAGLLAGCTSGASGSADNRSDYQKACELGVLTSQPTDRLISASFPAEASKHLVVILHGRSAIVLKGQPDATLFVKRAERLARDSGGTATVVAIARPGYRMQDAISPGESFGGIDNATAYNDAWVANEIETLKAEHNAERVTLIGDSEGGLVAAAIAACRPELVDHLLLGRCPCDLEAWPKLRAGIEPYVRSPSPIRLVEHFDDDLIVRITTAPMDKQTPIPLAQAFLDTAKARGLDAEGFFEGKKPGHGWSKVRDYLTQQVQVLTAE